MATNQEMHSATYVTVARNLDAKISGIPVAVADGVQVKRDGKKISWVQDTADTNTMVRELRASVAALTQLVGQLASGQEIDYDRIKEGTREVLAQETVSVEVSVKEQEQA
jgi:hypothetical protein